MKLNMEKRMQDKSKLIEKKFLLQEVTEIKLLSKFLSEHNRYFQKSEQI